MSTSGSFLSSIFLSVFEELRLHRMDSWTAEQTEPNPGLGERQVVDRRQVAHRGHAPRLDFGGQAQLETASLHLEIPVGQPPLDYLES